VGCLDRSEVRDCWQTVATNEALVPTQEEVEFVIVVGPKKKCTNEEPTVVEHSSSIHGFCSNTGSTSSNHTDIGNNQEEKKYESRRHAFQICSHSGCLGARITSSSTVPVHQELGACP
jgi:hypothetical protein